VNVDVLVTGSSGFIGRHLAAHLMERDWRVTGLDVVPAPDAPWHTVHCDIRDGTALAAAVSALRPAFIAHLAARTDLDGQTVDDYDTNTRGVASLLAAVNACEEVRRCIFTSTQLVGPPGHALPADDSYAPTTPYGESKAMGEEIARKWETPVEWCIVRPTTIWGPGMNAHYQRFFRHVARGTYFHVGMRRLEKSYGYVGNVAHQYEALLRAAAAEIDRRTYYVADYEPLCLQDWIEAFRAELDGPRIRTLPEPAARALARVGDVLAAAGWTGVPFTSFRLANILTEYQVDTKALRSICGALPFDQLAGVRATAQWLRHQQV
jgi:GlcNAc-P-P-Und epimerase